MAKKPKHPATASVALALAYLAAEGVPTADAEGKQFDDEKLFELVEQTAEERAAAAGAETKKPADKADPHNVKVKKAGATSFNGYEPDAKGVFTIPTALLDDAISHGFERV